jgi:hypothetical protein
MEQKVNKSQLAPAGLRLFHLWNISVERRVHRRIRRMVVDAQWEPAR